MLRVAEGYTRRANSANPLYDAGCDARKIDFCEDFYGARGLKTVFKITSDPALVALDEALAARGYACDAPTGVQVLPDLAALPAPDLTEIDASEEVTQRWLEAFYTLGGANRAHAAIHRRMLDLIAPRRCCLTLHQAGEPVAVALGVLERGWLGVYDVVVAADRRGQGLGTQLMLNLLHWGRSQGAAAAYLQVMDNNGAALALYARLGFVRRYGYWYRAKPG